MTENRLWTKPLRGNSVARPFKAPDPVIVAIPFAGARRQFLWAAVPTGLVPIECAVLAVNRGQCPLTDLAGRYTEERTDNFDIYLPLWLARHSGIVNAGRRAVGFSLRPDGELKFAAAR